MARNRTWTDLQLIEAVATKTSMMDVLRELRLDPYGTGNRKTVCKHIALLGLGTEHWWTQPPPYFSTAPSEGTRTGTRRTWTDAQLVELVSSKSNATEVLEALGLSRGSYVYLQEHIKRLGVSTNHWSHLRREWTDAQLTESVGLRFSMAAVLVDLGLKGTGGNYRSLWGHIKRLGLATTHWTGQGHLRGKTHSWTKKVPLSEVLVENSTFSTTHLSKRLVKEGVLRYECSEPDCLLSAWKGKPISLHLDHKNGVHTDNRLENLRLLCPNCHSQTETYGSKNIGKYKNGPTGI